METQAKTSKWQWWSERPIGSRFDGEPLMYGPNGERLHSGPAVATAMTELSEINADLLAFAKKFQEKAHIYGIWIARLERQPASHSEPIEDCQSPGCREARELIDKAEGRAS